MSQTAEPGERLVDHFGAFAERPAHERAARLDVVVEHGHRDRHDTVTLRQHAAEPHAVVEAERAYVGRDEVRSLRYEDVEAQVGETGAEPVAPRPEAVTEAGEVGVRLGERGGDRELERARSP